MRAHPAQNIDGPALPVDCFLGLRQNGVFHRFSHAELHHFLGWYIDLFSGGRIPPHTCLPVGATQPSEPWKNEKSGFPDFSNCGIRQVLKKLAGRLLTHLTLLGERSYDLRLRHALCCHNALLCRIKFSGGKGWPDAEYHVITAASRDFCSGSPENRGSR